MQTETDKLTLLKTYKEVGADTKKLMEAMYGKQTFSEKITDRVKTFEDACHALGIKPEDVLHSAHSPALERDIVSINAYSKLIVIIRALNEDWEANWNDDSEYKYYPWLKYTSGVGFSYSGYGYSHSATAVGSRLCFKSRELAEYAAVQFNKEYNEFFTLNK